MKPHTLLARNSAFFHDERAQAAVLAAFSMVAVLGFVGLAVDVGQLRFEKRRLQNAADAAALAASFEISPCAGSACSTMMAAAQSAVCENGYKLQGTSLPAACTSSTSGVALTVNNGPSTLGTADPHNGDAKYAEVLLTESQPLYFARMLGFRSMNITARAEGSTGSSSYCLYLMSPLGTTFQSNGGSLTSACGIYVNSSSLIAFQANGAHITAPTIGIHGGDQLNGSIISGNLTTNIAAQNDPLAYVPAPTVGGCGATNSSPYYGSPTTAQFNGSVSGTLNPGVYCGGIQVNGNAHLTLNPGTYILEGYLQLNGGTISGSGVTFYFTAGSVQFNGSQHVNLVAPTTGDYAGILFYQNPSDATPAQLNGDTSSVFQGALYFPSALLQLNGGNAAAYTIVDAASVQLNGSGFSIGNDYSSLPGGSPIKGGGTALVE